MRFTRATCRRTGPGEAEAPRIRRWPGSRGAPRAERGFASVIVLALICVLITLLLGNNHTLALLKTDLQRIEQRQAVAVTRPARPARVVPALTPPEASAPEPGNGTGPTEPETGTEPATPSE